MTYRKDSKLTTNVCISWPSLTDILGRITLLTLYNFYLNVENRCLKAWKHGLCAKSNVGIPRLVSGIHSPTIFYIIVVVVGDCRGESATEVSAAPALNSPFEHWKTPRGNTASSYKSVLSSRDRPSPLLYFGCRITISLSAPHTLFGVDTITDGAKLLLLKIDLSTQKPQLFELSLPYFFFIVCTQDGSKHRQVHKGDDRGCGWLSFML